MDKTIFRITTSATRIREDTLDVSPVDLKGRVAHVWSLLASPPESDDIDSHAELINELTVVGETLLPREIHDKLWA